MNHIVYKNLKNYKYQLVKSYNFQTEIKTDLSLKIRKSEVKVFVNLDPEGLLKIEAGYAWDGPSGPTIDTKNVYKRFSYTRRTLSVDARRKIRSNKIS
ncbi:Uncharacterized protein AMR50_3455 [Leptospira interrogans]|nr:Uncharacterized protein AMR50_3455 [Leptospira interrogans]